MMDNYEQGLVITHQYSPHTKEGFFGHMPMVIETLNRLGYGEKIPPYVETQKSRLVACSDSPSIVIDNNNWTQALSDRDRFSDWVNLFNSEFNKHGWQHSLNTWCGNLAKGFISSATHGVIRTAHAYQGLQQAPQSDIRQTELAHSLASWAIGYQELPVDDTPLGGQLNAQQALEHIPFVPIEHQSGEGFITAGYQTLKHVKGFSQAVGQLNNDISAEQLRDQVTTAFAEMFVQASHSPFTTVVFAHAVTANVAVGRLLPVLDNETAALLSFKAWQAGCALKSAFQTKESLPECHQSVVTKSEADYIKAAIDHGDAHVIKLSDACLEVYQRTKAPELLAAVEKIQSSA